MTQESMEKYDIPTTEEEAEAWIDWTDAQGNERRNYFASAIHAQFVFRMVGDRYPDEPRTLTIKRPDLGP